MPRKKPGRVSEPAPIQVYLERSQRERLERLAERLRTTKSDVVRRGIDALDRQVTDPKLHPALAIIGIAAPGSDDDTELGYSVARDHDRFLSDAMENDIAEWRKAHRGAKRRGRGGKTRRGR
jgi:hypothetical protein